jgi:hypothetical protein
MAAVATMAPYKKREYFIVPSPASLVVGKSLLRDHRPMGPLANEIPPPTSAYDMLPNF